MVDEVPAKLEFVLVIIIYQPTKNKLVYNSSKYYLHTMKI